MTTTAKINPADCAIAAFDVVDYLLTSADIDGYLQASYQTADKRQIARALVNAARAEKKLSLSSLPNNVAICF